MIKISLIPLRHLVATAQRFLAHQAVQSVTPITLHRALAHTQNPHAELGDIALIVATDRSKCVGYLGLLPAKVATPTRTQRVMFLTTIYVEEAYRGSPLSLALLRAAVGLKHDIVVTGYTTEASQLYRATGFKSLGHVDSVYLFLEKKPTNYSSVQGDDLRTRRNHHNRWLSYRDSLGSESVCNSDMSPTIPQWISCPGCSGRPHFCRDRRVLEWMVRYPWVKTGDTPTAPQYHFSDVRKLFRIRTVTVTSLNKALAWCVYSISETSKLRTMKILDHSSVTTSTAPSVLAAILDQAAYDRADKVEMPADIYTPTICQRQSDIAATKVRREYLYFSSKPNDSLIVSNRDAMKLNYCDGDTAFT
jgi:hypothetical protein